ncbi:hypothetical protein MXB_3816 [Myxobolus squamalis]|nr:hypothetical protein MXB_3816 [Myxobolus squamalis]
MAPKKESLMNIIQYIASDAYRNLIILSETLPRMSDSDRKLEIIKFSKESRSLFIRLLGVTKWAVTSKLYAQAESILTKIENHTYSFVDTADRLYQIARIQLPHCTIPLPLVAAAADIWVSESYNRLPTCFSHFPPKRPVYFDDHLVQKNISEKLIDILATHNFDYFSTVTLNQDYIGLGTNHFTADVTTLYDSKGPWKIINLTILVKNEQEATRSAVTQGQVNFLINFTESKISESSSPFELLYKIINHFCNGLIFEILLLQSRYIQFLMKFKLETSKGTIIIPYWYSFAQEAGDVHLGSEPPLDGMDENLHQKIVGAFQPFAYLIKTVDNSMIFKPSNTISEIYCLKFCLNEHSEFLQVRKYDILTYTKIDIYVQFLKDYQRFALLYMVKTLTYNYQSQWLKLIPFPVSQNAFPHPAISKLHNEYGTLHLAYVRATCSVSITVTVTVIAINFSDTMSVNYNICYLNSMAHKRILNDVKDIHIRFMLRNSYIYDLKYLQDISFFKYENFLRQIGWGQTFNRLLCQFSFRVLSLRELFLYKLDASFISQIIRKCLSEALLHYDIFYRKWLVELHISSFYFDSFSGLVSIPHFISIIIPTNSCDPFDWVMIQWKNFIFCLESLIKLTQYSRLMAKVSSLKLSLKSLTIQYGGLYKFIMKICVFEDTPFISFYSHSCHTNPHSSHEFCSFVGRHYERHKNIVKILNIVVNISLDSKLLCSLRPYVCQHADMTLIQYNLSYSINVLFLDKDIVQISDITFMGLWSDSNIIKSSIIPMYFLDRFLANQSFSIGYTCSKSLPCTFTIHKSVLTYILRINSIKIIGNDIFKRMTAVNIFFESCFLLRAISSLYRLAPFTKIENSLVSFKVGPFTIVIGFSMNIHRSPLYIYFNIISTEPDSYLEPISTVLEEYFYRRDENFDSDWTIRWRHLPCNSFPFSLLPVHPASPSVGLSKSH